MVRIVTSPKELIGRIKKHMASICTALSMTCIPAFFTFMVLALDRSGELKIHFFIWAILLLIAGIASFIMALRFQRIEEESDRRQREELLLEIRELRKDYREGLNRNVKTK